MLQKVLIHCELQCGLPVLDDAFISITVSNIAIFSAGNLENIIVTNVTIVY